METTDLKYYGSVQYHLAAAERLYATLSTRNAWPILAHCIRMHYAAAWSMAMRYYMRTRLDLMPLVEQRASSNGFNARYTSRAVYGL